MSRPTIAQLLTGTLTVVAAAAVLLAVSGSRGVFEIAVLVAFAVALGTLATALLVTVSAQRRAAGSHRPQARPTTTPEYATQR
ncbi:uncharacterized membrane protein YebE (DUF533 family) [Kitasatospora gansuensis]|uniref:Uncharacterized membrane protein YebE (DUF533 family) n=1 Tax=Kitasatospora gansuensis TaxID=258050 RepID=A0A7W7SEK9_9ACTN|nr:hypothetical protein [Kitasatospora gansuensis]MBB4949059.1 uncharacterized membrane protein YebE (DUF533 family) [Kitasatospora gansuensis]